MLRPLLAAAIAALPLVSEAHAADLFVDASLTSGADDGSSWSNAFQGPGGLSRALAAALPNDRVLVAQGTYLPSLTGDRTASFVIPYPIEVYGGFVGGESSPAERPDPAQAPTVLSGDLASNDPTDITDNSLVVVRVSAANAGTLLDGLVVRAGYNDSIAPGESGGITFESGAVGTTVRSCEIVDNVSIGSGGGASVRFSSTARFVSCDFARNVAGSQGGAFAMMSSSGNSVQLERCRFTDNLAVAGGAVSMRGTFGTVVANCTFQNNVAVGDVGGAIYSSGGSAGLRLRGCTIVGNRSLLSTGGGLGTSSFGTGIDAVNCIVWGNLGPGPEHTFASQASGTVSFTSSIVEGIAAGANNLNVDPLLVDVGAGDLRPTLASPAIDAGDNSEVVSPPSGALLDVDGFRRQQDVPSVPDTGLGAAPIVDIGAHEYATLIGKPYCVAALNSTGQPARLDASGSVSIADNDVTLSASQLPTGVLGYFLTSRTPSFVPNAGGASGDLCLGGAIGRFSDPSQVVSSGPLGEASFSLDLAAHPTPTGAVSVMAGETWRFQMWFRDSVLGFSTSNLTEAVSITFEQ